MTEKIIARRYARALFAIGKEKGDAELTAYGKDLASMAEALESSPELLKIFKNPIFKDAVKKGILAKLVEALKLSDMVKNFCFLLADKDRLAYLPDIETYFRALLDADQGVVRGELVTAIELAKADQDKIKSALEQQASQKLVLDYAVDRDILGGLVLKVGDKMYDASLRAQLQILKENIKRGE
ncbi:MAG: ATP synthase F1 subunit delta [Desulfohalobiaceae bacterium]